MSVTETLFLLKIVYFVHQFTSLKMREREVDVESGWHQTLVIVNTQHFDIFVGFDSLILSAD